MIQNEILRDELITELRAIAEHWKNGQKEEAAYHGVGALGCILLLFRNYRHVHDAVITTDPDLIEASSQVTSALSNEFKSEYMLTDAQFGVSGLALRMIIKLVLKYATPAIRELIETILDYLRDQQDANPLSYSESPASSDPVNHPPHYTGNRSGIECIDVTENMNFCVGNAVKYLWRAELKGDYAEDLKKAKWYIERELNRIGE